jgi:chromosome segregation ATPase
MKNLKLFTLSVGMAILLLSCDVKEKQQLLSKVDSLQIELQTSQQMANTLQEVGVLLDSIDATRQVLRTNVVEGTSYADYQNRLGELNEYIRQSQQKIAELEKTMKKSSANYSATIKRLKNDLALRNEQLAALELEVAKFKNENELLTSSLSEKTVAIAEQLQLIQLKEENIAALEAKVSEINQASQTSKAELYYAQAAALETAAHRTKFAPRKKKETQREALELYKISLSLGHVEAEERIAQLEKELG